MIDVGTGLEVEELRCIDEAFAKICNMINDLSLEVKVQAAKVLVSSPILPPITESNPNTLSLNGVRIFFFRQGQNELCKQ
jgi:hypothetical protein